MANIFSRQRGGCLHEMHLARAQELVSGPWGRHQAPEQDLRRGHRSTAVQEDAWKHSDVERVRSKYKTFAYA
jgi:hypothetical protein